MKKWQDLTPLTRATLLFVASVELSMAATAWADLAIRPKTHLNGSKPMWAALIGVSFVGPIAYAVLGVHSRHVSPIPED
ncbi:hypothetical protein OEB99_11515 [Actinotalea sp. M2MS4P-6]|uniref:hypothetical protein n=1 Tax=Actinotalea sp. M2MS4P-6 TaxID=2983762 RepID=UPI0021E479CD|nr:hypothetical protein [Actinotalea sp. M2MS4P-6]MCV2394937.1 hypothetical protein [Actinotalea sp. M2MS4P-6]